MKQFKSVIICAAALVVISLAVFAAIKLIPNKASEAPGGPNVPESSENICITEFLPEEISSVEITSDSGESFEIEWFETEFGRDARIRGENGPLAYNSRELSTLAHYLGPLVALEELEAGEDEVFGFDSPRRTVKISLKNGERVTLLLGDSLAINDGAYLRRADSSNVYIVGKTIEHAFMKTKSEYREIELFKTFEDTELITMAEYTPHGKEPIRVVRKSEEEIALDAERTLLDLPYKLTSPVSANANPDTINEAFLKKIVGIEADHVVEDNPKDLSKYGLDKAAKLRFETANGISVSILIGATTKNGTSYIMEEGIPSVLETKEAIDLSTLSHTDITMRLIWFFNSNEVSSLQYKLADGRAATLNLSVTENEVKGSFNGKELSGSNAQNLFVKSVRFSLAGEYSGSNNLTEAEIAITARLKNGKRSTLSLHRLNERQYAARVDGKPAEFYVAVGEVKELVDAIELAFSGKDIPSMF